MDYLDAQGARRTLETPLTFADFAAGHPAWQAHFRILPPEREDEALLPLDEYLALGGEERAEHLPFVWTVDMRGRLLRLGLSPAVVRASGERLALWRLLRGLTRADLVPVDEEAIAEGARQEVVETVWRNLLDWARDDGAGLAEALGDAAGAASRPSDGTGGEEPHA